MTFEQTIREDLIRYLTSTDKIDSHLPECPDIEELWPAIEEAYLPDAVREFQDYPVVSLGWIMFVGMAMAKFWDVDWVKYSSVPAGEIYNNLRDGRGFDEMDDYILTDILGYNKEEAEAASATVAECAARTLSALHRSNFEGGTPAAVNAYRGALHQLYLMGIAMELKALGYHMTKL